MIKKSNNNPFNKRKTKRIATPEFLGQILKGDIAYLSKAITLIESLNESDKIEASNLLHACLPYANKSLRIGITGVPGVGKSTFIESFGTYLTSLGKKVAVLAVDPSSSINKGSILGDKTRMEKLVNDKNAFIRPSPAGDSLGGVAKKTREAITLCEAAGFDIILIETVGVGQSETLVHNMVDFFLLLKVAGTGDELQGIKRGIIEMADSIVINKADGNNVKNAEFAKKEFERALHLFPQKENKWSPKVTTCSSIQNEGIENIWAMIKEFLKITTSNNWFQKNRNEQNKKWLLQSLNQRLQDDFYTNKKVTKELEKYLIRVEKQDITASEASKYLIEFYRKNN